MMRDSKKVGDKIMCFRIYELALELKSWVISKNELICWTMGSNESNDENRDLYFKEISLPSFSFLI